MVDGAIVTNLARALPKLETLRLGSDPCGAAVPAGVTIKGLIELAPRCTDLSTHRVHVQVGNLVREAVGETGVPSAGNAAARQGCSLATLEVGNACSRRLCVIGRPRPASHIPPRSKHSLRKFRLGAR